MTDGGRLSDEAVLVAWEEAAGAGPVERALALAVAASPGIERGSLERWSIGRRDGLLLAVHAASFGESLVAITPCPECSETLELALRTSELRAENGDADAVHELVVGDRRIRFRVPTSADLRHAVSGSSDEDARARLLERCIVAVEPEAPELSPEAIEALAAHMAACDPQSDVRLALTCPACTHAWSVGFDIADFLWRKVDDRARLLLSHIATLASAFGWREQEILALGETRRSHYLALVGG